MALHTFFLFPETAGKTLEDIEEMFMQGTPAWKTRVDFSNSQRAEQGIIDPEKIGGFDQSSIKMENADLTAKA